MSKDPAFLFYSSDFLTGTSDLTMEERGQYITLLCLQHQKGRLSRKAVAIAVVNATADVMAKFKIDKDGNYFNERLESEANKRKKHSEKQRKRAKDGWIKRRAAANAAADTAVLPLEDENENENIIKVGNEILRGAEKIKIFDDWVRYKKDNGKKIKNNQTFERLIRKFNQYSVEDITCVVDASIENNWAGLFWNRVDELKAKAKKEETKGLTAVEKLNKSFGL